MDEGGGVGADVCLDASTAKGSQVVRGSTWMFPAGGRVDSKELCGCWMASVIRITNVGGVVDSCPRHRRWQLEVASS